jgi:hypothetical protein
MKIKQAREIFEKIVELCYESENTRLIEVIESIYSDVENADSYSDIYISCQEIQIIINEEEFSDEEEEIISEIEELIESLSE